MSGLVQGKSDQQRSQKAEIENNSGHSRLSDLRALVRDAYNEGFYEGMREANPNFHNGGKNFTESKTAVKLAALNSVSEAS